MLLEIVVLVCSVLAQPQRCVEKHLPAEDDVDVQTPIGCAMNGQLLMLPWLEEEAQRGRFWQITKWHCGEANQIAKI